MIESVSSADDYQFEPVHITWSGLRTQMIVGLLAIFCLCLINFIHLWQRNCFALADNSFIDFTLYLASCSLVTLITLAIGRTGGNRNGAGSAIWSALIFAVSPCWHSHFDFVFVPWAQLAMAGYILIGLILCWRYISHTITWQTAGTIILCLTAIWIQSSVCPGMKILTAAVSSIALSLACLPAFGAAPARFNKLYGTLGLIALTLIAIVYEQLLVGY